MLTQENLVTKFAFLNCCINEGLRLEPPVRMSTPHVFKEDVEVGGFPFKKHEVFNINFYHLHRNSQEWIHPDDFIPERFDPKSKYYLTPDGRRRHPGSFMPFLNGRRKCLGYHFAETVTKAVSILLLSQLNLEFVNHTYDYLKLPMDAKRFKKCEVKLSIHHLEI